VLHFPEEVDSDGVGTGFYHRIERCRDILFSEHATCRNEINRLIDGLHDVTIERDAWKASTREHIREYLSKDPDLRARQISDPKEGALFVIEAEHDLTKTKLARTQANLLEALEALRGVKPFVHRYIAKCPEEATPAVLKAELEMLKVLDKAKEPSS
jgi:hypothetical protein